MDESLLDLMSHGAGAMWVVLGFSVLAIAVAIERAIAQWNFVTHARALGETVTRCLARGALEEGRSACERSPSPIADVFLVGYERLGRTKPELVATSVHRERLRVMAELRARLWMLGTIGATAPFVGLFGTVVGIRSAMQNFKGEDTVKFGEVSGPIGGALIVTAFGIVVAVIAVVLFNFFSQRAGRIATEMKLLTDEFLELLLESPGASEPTRAKKPEKPEDEDKDEKKKEKPRGDREAA